MPNTIEKSEKSFDEMYFSKDEKQMPVIRITKIELNGFKSVNHGEVVFDCGKQFVPFGTQSDILGVYGQNGSGKTSLIQALAILKMAMGGGIVRDLYSDCISVKNKVATLAFTFDFQYRDGGIKQVEYRFSIEKVRLSREEIEDRLQKMPGDRQEPIDESEFDDERLRYKIRVFDESVKMLRISEDGQKTRLQTMISTADKCEPFGPTKKLHELIGTKSEVRAKLAVYKEDLAKESKSFIFNEKTLKELIDCDMAPVYCRTLLELRYFARRRLFVIDTKPSGMIGLNVALPIYTKKGMIMGSMWQGRMTVKGFEEVSKIFSNISLVLSQIVPGLSIELKKISETMTSKGKPGYMVIPVAYRGDVEMPLRDESDGVRKIISVLSLIIAAYNDPSITVAIDEFDAGVFEYLLGEILQSFEESGKGQLIFTSHNLRPLEVIDKKFLIFTTTNPDNRYYRIKDVASTNNLRDKYYREIILGGQSEELYNKTKRFKIESAMRKAYKS